MRGGYNLKWRASYFILFFLEMLVDVMNSSDDLESSDECG